MPYNSFQRFKSNPAFSQIFMAVLVSPPLILGIIDMKRCNLILSDDPVELADHALNIIHYVITRIMGMTGVEADTQFIVMYNSVIDSRLFFKASTDFGAFSRHRLKGHHTVQICRQHLI